MDKILCCPPALPPPKLYAGFTSEQKARAAVQYAFTTNPSKLNTEYRIRRVVGWGANGVVLSGVAGATDVPVAIKICYKSIASNSTHVAHPEISVYHHLAALDYSPHLLRYLDDWQDDRHVYLVTELFGSDWLAGSSSVLVKFDPVVFDFAQEDGVLVSKMKLEMSPGSSDLWAYRHFLANHTDEGAHVPIEQIKRIIFQTARGLQYIHNHGYYHGDIKQENLLIDTKLNMKVADLGSTKHITTGLKSYGTVDITPPELLEGSPFTPTELDGRDADVFALGLVLYSLLNKTGELPAAVARIRDDKSIGYRQLINMNHGQFPLGDTTGIDPDALHLLLGMTEVEPMMRMSICQVLSHRFLQQ